MMYFLFKPESINKQAGNDGDRLIIHPGTICLLFQCKKVTFLAICAVLH